MLFSLMMLLMFLATTACKAPFQKEAPLPKVPISVIRPGDSVSWDRPLERVGMTVEEAIRGGLVIPVWNGERIVLGWNPTHPAYQRLVTYGPPH